MIDHQFGENETPGFDYLCKTLNEYTILIGDISQDAEANKPNKTITLNKDFCGENADPVALAETISHESMHYALWAVEIYLNGEGPPNDPVIREHYDNLLNGFSGLYHEFLSAYVDDIALTLCNMNGMVNSIENYRGLI